LARQKIIHNGIEVRSLFGCLAVGATGFAEVIEHDVYCELEVRLGS
jgi:hypothetical protein